MAVFATEFPAKRDLDRAVFISHVIAWLRGHIHSTVLDRHDPKEFEKDSAHLVSESGEGLRLMEFKEGQICRAVGFRHDYPDLEGRLWRTEAVLLFAASEGDQNIIRFKTACMAERPEAKIEIPKKPHIIRSFLERRFGDVDGLLDVGDAPIVLEDSGDQLDLAQSIISGDATNFLPVVYVSAADSAGGVLTESQVRKLAFDLGGVAHIVVEPSRSFSFRLRDKSQGKNVYGGALGISLPRRGIVTRNFLGFRFPSASDLVSGVLESTKHARLYNMPFRGWDWTDLQERSLKEQRSREKKRLSETELQETYRIYENEIADLKQEIEKLKGERSSVAAQFKSDAHGDLVGALDSSGLCPEIYPGEVADRLMYAAKLCLDSGDKIGLDGRSAYVFKLITSKINYSPDLAELKEDLSRVTKDPKRIARELTALLCRHGYQEKSDNKHIRLEPQSDFGGLESVTIPKTPSDERGLKNLRRDTEKKLGISRLSD